MNIQHLPPELILRICQLMTRTKDTGAVSRTCQSFRQIATPFLYKSITLTNCETAYNCCRTLATASLELASYVRSFKIEACLLWNFTHQHHVYFRKWLIWSVQRMSHLLDFRCMLLGSFGPDMCAALSLRRSLRSLAISVPDRDHLIYQEPPKKSWPREELRPIWPSLEHFEYTSEGQHPLRPSYEQFIQHVLQHHALHLRSLHFPGMGPEYFQVLIPASVQLPALQTLNIMSSTLTPGIAAQMPDLRSLTFPNYESVVDPSIPATAFLNLERFYGSCRCFGDILDAERPITFVQFDRATFDMDDETIFAEDHQPTWSDLYDALELFHVSSGPIRNASFYIRSMRLSQLQRVVRFLHPLESLTICLREDLKDSDKLESFGKHVLKQMPYLHTFLLSDEPAYIYRGKRFSHAHNITMQKHVLTQWEKHCRTLRRVSFTASFVWDKMYGEWSRCAGPRRERP